MDEWSLSYCDNRQLLRTVLDDLHRGLPADCCRVHHLPFALTLLVRTIAPTKRHNINKPEEIVTWSCCETSGLAQLQKVRGVQ